MKSRTIITGILLLAGILPVSGQLSGGGYPRDAGMKSSLATEILPPANNEVLRWQNAQSPGLLKPLTFAHPFKVRLNPSSHGTWSRSADGWQIWRLKIVSEGALSLNVLFENFSLPDKARLFLYTPDYSSILGAFTADNNTEEGIFQVSPLPGDEVVVQYEIPGTVDNPDGFVITRVNHDFLGILKYEDKRRPLNTTAGACNTDINCRIADKWRNVQNSTCRVMVQGTVFCTGTLLNNTAQNRKPYVLTANHCVGTNAYALGSLFLFNYESPYCGSLDGDVSHSLTGSRLKATFDSLDFALLELNVPPPPTFRPYYAGWSRSTQVTDTLAIIHHPQGDIKKIAVDHNIPVITSFYPTFLNNAFWKTLKWEVGTTENGSSGGPCFNRQKLLTGTLSGGEASCSNSVNDYFARFDMAWDYRTDTLKQLKYWLDPLRQNPLTLEGKQFFEKEELCKTFTNLSEGDAHQLLRTVNSSGADAGYWTGTNGNGITEVADLFTIHGNEQIRGVSLGVARKHQTNRNNGSFITISIYNFSNQTATLAYFKDSILLRNLVTNAMNLVDFDQVVEPADTFLIAFNLENLKSGDTLALFHTIRNGKMPNSLWLLKAGNWVTFLQENPSGYAASLALETTACNVGIPSNGRPVEDPSLQLQVYPNPATSKIQIWSKEPVAEDQVSIYNMQGKQVKCRIGRTGPLHLEVTLAGNPPGIYLVKIRYKSEYIQSKFLFVPY